MRITNSMSANAQILNLHRSHAYINKIVQQIESKKTINNPSENPIVASKALKYRASVSETQQFIKNNASGLSWMEVTESAYRDVNENLFEEMERLLTEGATGTETQSDKMAIVTSLKELIGQIGLDVNQTYAGRYVFSGYKTDEPPVYIEDNELSYVITQEFEAQDIEAIMSYQKDVQARGFNPAVNEALTHGANIIKLAYTDVSFNFNMTGNAVTPGINSPAFEYKVVTKSIQDMNAYTPPANPNEDGSAANPYVVHYIQETGELVLSGAAAETFADGTSVTYHKDNFKKGELNPLIYFGCVEAATTVKPPKPTVTLAVGGPAVDPSSGEYAFTFDRTATDASGTTTETGVSISGGATQGPVMRLYGASGGYTDVNLWGSSVANASTSGPPPRWENTYEVKTGPFNLTVTQNVSQNESGYTINYDITNHSAADVKFDFLQHIGTDMAGHGDMVYNYSDVSRSSNASLGLTLVPDENDPTTAVVVDFSGGASAPDAVNIGSGGDPATFDTFPSAGDAPSTGSSGFAVIWRGNTVAKDGSFSTSMFYGVEDITEAPPVELTFAEEFPQEDQYIKYECANNNFQRINSLGKYFYTDNMYADLRRLAEFTESLEISDENALRSRYSSPPYNLTGANLESAVSKQLSGETALLNSALQDRFNNMLGLLERHFDNAASERSMAGNRAATLELLRTKIETDEIIYTKLLSENEDTDMEQAILRKAMSESAYSIALNVTARITKLSLADYI